MPNANGLLPLLFVPTLSPSLVLLLSLRCQDLYLMRESGYLFPISDCNTNALGFSQLSIMWLWTCCTLSLLYWDMSPISLDSLGFSYRGILDFFQKSFPYLMKGGLCLLLYLYGKLCLFICTLAPNPKLWNNDEKHFLVCSWVEFSSILLRFFLYSC